MTVSARPDAADRGAGQGKGTSEIKGPLASRLWAWGWEGGKSNIPADSSPARRGEVGYMVPLPARCPPPSSAGQAQLVGLPGQAEADVMAGLPWLMLALCAWRSKSLLQLPG